MRDLRRTCVSQECKIKTHQRRILVDDADVKGLAADSFVQIPKPRMRLQLVVKDDKLGAIVLDDERDKAALEPRQCNDAVPSIDNLLDKPRLRVAETHADRFQHRLKRLVVRLVLLVEGELIALARKGLVEFILAHWTLSLVIVNVLNALDVDQRRQRRS